MKKSPTSPGAAAGALAALLGACAPAAGPGRLDGALVQAAASARGVELVYLDASSGGALGKLSVYHHEEAQVPEAVRRLAEEKLPGGKVRRYESELYAQGGRVFEVEIETQDGRHCEVSATAEGALRYLECEIAQKDLPPAVVQAVAQAVPGGEIAEAETQKGPSIDEVHVEVKAGGALHYLRLRPSGELLRHSLRLPAAVDVPYAASR